MCTFHIFIIFLLLTRKTSVSALSFNQPNFSSTPIWNPNAITFANESIIGHEPEGIFITTNNTIYFPHQHKGEILVWYEGSSNPTEIIPINLSLPYSLFVTSNGDIYISDYATNGRVQKWISKNKSWLIVMDATFSFLNLFVDVYDNLYCSMERYHEVVKRELSNSLMTSTRIAGTGIGGSGSDQLNAPNGIFVDVNLDLYVADCFNHRVQLFQSGQSHAITVVGDTIWSSTISLDRPTGIVLDAHKYLFIVDMGNSRIVGSGPRGWRCLVGCTKHDFVSESNQLSQPYTLSFDRVGNMYVTDYRHNRIQKFELLTNCCTWSFNQPILCHTASWKPYATTFIKDFIDSNGSRRIFITTNNTIYIPRGPNKGISVWHEGNNNPTKHISGNFSSPYSLFVTSNDDVFISDMYIDHGKKNGRVQKWISQNNTWITVMMVNSTCYDVFVDIHDNLFCSMRNHHQVVRTQLNSSSMTLTVVAGTGIPAPYENHLNEPHGIFVDVNLDLYVADCQNDRVQLFQSGQSSAITAAKYLVSAPRDSLKCPTGLVLDTNRYLYIVDSGKNRIVASGPNGWRCLVGCHGQGSQSNQLSAPSTLSFDRFGNMYVIDQSNHRIQKFEFMENSCVRPFNQPKFCSTPVWNRKGRTFVNQKTIGSNPRTIFINQKNSIYAINREKQQILIWHNNHIDPTSTMNTEFSNSSSLFVTSNGNVYVDDGETNARIQKWTQTTNQYSTVLFVFSSCKGIFIDRNETLYCSMPRQHQVITRDLNDFTMKIIMIAGTGILGSTSNQLNTPLGIFVDTNLNLYVADCGNNRVQLFQSGKSNGIKVAGDGLYNSTISLNCPSGVTLDAQNHLFIVDSNNHRIIRSGSSGARCVVGCYGSGSQSTQLFHPSTISFDQSGNLFVVDTGNNRIQKFQYLQNSCDMSSVIRLSYLSTLNNNSQIYSKTCKQNNYYYDAFQINVPESRTYTIRSSANIDTYGFLYENSFDALNPNENILATNDDDESTNGQFYFEIPLYADTTYFLVVTTTKSTDIGEIKIDLWGLKNVNVTRLIQPVNIQVHYPFELTVNSPLYYRDCQIPKCYYEGLEIVVDKDGEYVIWSVGEVDTYGFIYKYDFDPLKPHLHLLFEHNGTCNQGQFKFIIDLEMNTRYVLVATTSVPYTTGSFSIFISGQNNVTVNRFKPQHSYCIIGDQCNFHSKSIGLTLDDILYEELREKTSLNHQSFSVKLSAALTIIMFIGGLINSILSFITFKSKAAQQVGCGLYLFASSVTSLLTISMFFIKFWFVVFTRINISVSLSVLRGGCVSIEPLLKLFLYLDGWLNGCVAVERAIQVLKGASFDKKKSKRCAQWIIIILPFTIMATLIHEPIYRHLFEFKLPINETVGNQTYMNMTNEGTLVRYTQCVTRYSSSVQIYNTVILFFHLLGPFVINLLSALFIIFGGARRRSNAKTDQTLLGHVRKQFDEHKQLIISPIVLLVLSIPRLIIALLSACVNTSDNLWLYLSAYFVSFIPSILIFMIFVMPSQLYMKTFKESLNRWRRQTYQSLTLFQF